MTKGVKGEGKEGGGRGALRLEITAGIPRIKVVRRYLSLM